MKIFTIVGTRPELIKLCCVIKRLDQCAQHVLVHTGQNYDYELNGIFFEEIGIRKPNYFLDCAKSVSSPAEVIGHVIAKTDRILEFEKPDAFLLLGDTNSCLAAYAAKRRKIPIFHMEAGNRCFDMRVPEEINRKLVDHLSDINFVYTEHARRYLLHEGFPGEQIIKTGSPMQEIYQTYADEISQSKIHDRLNLTTKKYFIVSAHREENIDCKINLDNFLQTLKVVAKTYNLPIIVSAHPRLKKALTQDNMASKQDIRFIDPLGFFDYVFIQQHSFCTISDSGTITEESSLLGFPAVMIRNAHERPEGMDEGTVVMCGLKPHDVLAAINIVSANQGKRVTNIVGDYKADNVSHKVLRSIYSYTGYINRVTWFKV